MKEKINYQKLDVPISFRIPHELHKKYKNKTSFERKEIQYKFVKWLERVLK